MGVLLFGLGDPLSEEGIPFFHFQVRLYRGMVNPLAIGVLVRSWYSAGKVAFRTGIDIDRSWRVWVHRGTHQTFGRSRLIVCPRLSNQIAVSGDSRRTLSLSGRSRSQQVGGFDDVA